MTEKESKAVSQKQDTNWILVLWYIHLHALGVYGLWLLFVEAQWLTVLFTFFIIGMAGLGVTVGAHRLWAHESFQASFIVRLFLILAHTLAGVGPVYDWIIAHKMHHKYYGTKKDPYKHEKGFFYSHVISNLLFPPSDIEEIKKTIDMRSVESDRLVWFQQKFYWLVFIVFGLLLPVNAPAEYWGESLRNSIFILCFFRFAITVNIAWLVNSAMLIWGLKPGDKFPIDDNSVFFVRKSYWINYHYLMPWDWMSGEFGSYDSGDSTFFIRICRDLGLVKCLKTTSGESVRDALYKAATKKIALQDVLDEVKQNSLEKAKMEDLRYHH